MKKLVGIFAVLMIFSAAAFANGPLLGVSFVPTIGSGAWNLTAGWDFGPANLEVQKANLATMNGPWNFAALWTPSIGTLGYRAGANITLAYWPAPGTITYQGFGFILGVSNTWGPVQLFGQLDLRPRGVLQVIPQVGINFLFGDLIPPKSGTVVGAVRQ